MYWSSLKAVSKPWLVRLLSVFIIGQVDQVIPMNNIYIILLMEK